MPVNWRPTTSRIQQLIQAEEARIRALEQDSLITPVENPAPQQQQFGLPATPQEPMWRPSNLVQQPVDKSRFMPPSQFAAVAEPAIAASRAIAEPIPVFTPTPAAVSVAEPSATEEEPIDVPLWQRGLQIFSAPFEWVDETIIKPGLALAGTAVGMVEDVERQPGEDFWAWKKRAWEGWEAPGIDINVPWRDDPWRVDFKGVLELAPWLLIPGAGQVGTATRAATGFAGLLAKAGRVGRIAGKAVQYSPWGLVEQTAGAAIKGGIRAAGNVSERISTKVGEKLYGKYVPPPIPPEVAELTKYFKETVLPARKGLTRAIPELRARQTAGTRAAFESFTVHQDFRRLQQDLALGRSGAISPEFALTPEALGARQASAIAKVQSKVNEGIYSESVGRGLITKIRRNPAYVATEFTDDKVLSLINMVRRGSEDGLVNADSVTAFVDLMMNGKVPEPRFIKREWPKVFGEEFAKAVGSLKGVPPDKITQALDILNIPRATQAALDMSGTARQGLFFMLLHPTKAPIWFGRQVKALMSEKWALEIDDAMRAHPQFQEIMSATGAYIAPIKDASFSKAEELFASKAARHIPGIRRSERAFVTQINQGRWATLQAGYNAMTAQGATPEQLKLFGRFVDLASGRGEIPKSLEKFSPVLNALLFSPRLQASTIQLPRQLGRMLLSDNPYMRKEAAKALGTFVGGGVGLLGLLGGTGIAKVETDPRSGDFGKIRFKIGEDANGQPKYSETRLDIWRGYLQYTRFAAQLLSGERKSAYGNMNKAERSEIVSRFLQSKSSPAAGLITDLLRGETFQGEPIFKDTTGFNKAAMQRIIPLALQDIVDGMEQSGINGVMMSAPGILGVGALTYVSDLVKVKDKIAKENGYDSWDDIDPKKQREIENRSAELQAATIAFDRIVMGTAWGDWRGAMRAVDEVFEQNVAQATAKFRSTGKGFEFREDVSNAFTQRRGGYAAMEKEERFADIVKRLNVKDTAEAMVVLGPEQLAIKTYNDALFGDDMYDEFGDYRFDLAEERRALLQMELGPMFDYVEDYRELKFENLPPEFKDLMDAKKIMRPYWQVRDKVIALFGERFADSPAGSSLISKLRKTKRLSSPDIEASYQRFYAQ